MTLSSREKDLFSLMTPFFLLCSCFRTHPTNTRPTSQNIGETDAWAVPHSNFGGTVPSPSRSPLVQAVLISQVMSA